MRFAIYSIVSRSSRKTWAVWVSEWSVPTDVMLDESTKETGIKVNVETVAWGIFVVVKLSYISLAYATAFLNMANPCGRLLAGILRQFGCWVFST